MSASVAAVPSTQNHPAPTMDTAPPQPLTQLPNIASEHMYKNKLQEYAQKSSLPLPVYQTVNEGAPHAPRFRSTVWVDESQYTSSTTFSHRKAAEQDVARIALAAIPQKIKDKGCPFIQQDTTFCKSILNEYAAKKRLEKPTYNTTQSEGLLPVFVSVVVFDGIGYTGNTGRNKKEAEQLAARAAILSILDSVNAEDIYDIIKSKLKLYAAINGLKETDSSSCSIPVLNGNDHPDFNLNKRKQDGLTAFGINFATSGISECTLGATSTVQPAPAPLHEFKKPKPHEDVIAISPLLTFVSASLPQPVHPSTSRVKQGRRKKKKSKRGLQVNSQTSSSAAPMHQIPAHTITQ